MIVAGAALLERHGVEAADGERARCPGETYRSARRTLALNAVIRPAVANASVFMPYPRLEMTRIAIESGSFDGSVDMLSDNYYHRTVLKFESERDARRILNLRHFFSLLAHHPRLLPLVEPLLAVRENALYRWLGDLVDGYYLRRCLPYRMTPRDFLRTLRHFLFSYRRAPAAGRRDRPLAASPGDGPPAGF